MVSSIERFHCIQDSQLGSTVYRTTSWVPMVSSIERFHCTVQWELCIVQWPHALHTRITWNEHSLDQHTHFYLHSPDEFKPSVSMLFKVGYVLLKIKLIVDISTIRKGIYALGNQCSFIVQVNEMQRKGLRPLEEKRRTII